MKIFSFILPLFIGFILIFATVKKVDVFNAFTTGVKKTLSLIYSIFPYLCAVLIMTEIMRESGVYELIGKFLHPLFNFFKIPTDLIPLIILKPFSGGGSLAVLADIYQIHGTESYISRCASVIYGSSETVFYLSAVYFCNCKHKNLKKAIFISLFSTFLSCIFACFVCRVL